jgi:hypothetical protein
VFGGDVLVAGGILSDRNSPDILIALPGAASWLGDSPTATTVGM